MIHQSCQNQKSDILSCVPLREQLHLFASSHDCAVQTARHRQSPSRPSLNSTSYSSKSFFASSPSVGKLSHTERAMQLKYCLNTMITRPSKLCNRQPIYFFQSLNPLILINIAYIGSWKHFVFVFVCVCVSLSFCKYSSRSLSSPDDKLSENIWFVWSKTSNSGDKWLGAVHILRQPK